MHPYLRPLRLRNLGHLTLNAARALVFPAALVVAAALAAHRYLGWP